MILQKIFSDGALFQADVALNIRGQGQAGAAVKAVICGKNGIAAESDAVCDSEGRFELTLSTPGASFATYEMEITCGEETHHMQDVLFGELWLTSGQSNMELTNHFIAGAHKLYKEVAPKTIRVYHVDYPPYGGDGLFPWEPDDTMTGRWLKSENAEDMVNISAAGLKFASDLYDFLNKNADVPVGFLNASWGGTSMRAWLPRAEIETDAHMTATLDRQNLNITPENWNTKEGGNFQQTSAMYNVKIAPLTGVKVRGVLWYQGENEASGEHRNRAYADYLRFYHRVYAEKFAADPENFMMISSLIYPWTYGPDGECCIGYVNQAFIETAAESPEKFAAIPIGDLPPTWSFQRDNHPIHPTQKYPLGERMAKVAMNTVYGRETCQKTPATLKSWAPCGKRMQLTFDSVGTGLFVNGENPVGLYVAGEDKVYFPAECKAEGNVLEVWCDAVEAPRHAAYSIQSLEPGCNLWAGEFPVLPFFTDLQGELIRIQARPWYDTARTSVWAGNDLSSEKPGLFYYPIFNAEPGSRVCPDDAFSLEGTSLRVFSDAPAFGFYVESWPYNRLDLANFGKLTMQLFNPDTLTARLVVEWDNGMLEIPFVQTEDLLDGWAAYAADLTAIPAEVEITKMHFAFMQADRKRHFVNVEKLRLWKK